MPDRVTVLPSHIKVELPVPVFEPFLRVRYQPHMIGEHRFHVLQTSLKVPHVVEFVLTTPLVFTRAQTTEIRTVFPQEPLQFLGIQVSGKMAEVHDGAAGTGGQKSAFA